MKNPRRCVAVSPMIFVPNQLVGAPIGTDATIDCHTEAYPRAMSYWFLGEEMILSNEKYTTSIMENSYRAHMRLIVRNLTTNDFGSYRCISKNSLGETEGSIRLYRKPICTFYLPPAILRFSFSPTLFVANFLFSFSFLTDCVLSRRKRPCMSVISRRVGDVNNLRNETTSSAKGARSINRESPGRAFCLISPESKIYLRASGRVGGKSAHG